MEQQKQTPEAFYSLKQAAEFMHIKKQAVYAAIRKGNLKSTRVGRRHVILKKDVLEYQANKYNRSKRMANGERIFDMDKGRCSVLEAAYTIGQKLNRRYDVQRIYYLIRSGKLKASKAGAAWVISVEDAKALYEKEFQNDKGQMRFA